MIKILVVGLIYNPNYEKDIIKNSNVGVSVASNTYLWNLINGIKECDCSIDVIGSIPYGSFPKLSNKIIVKDKMQNYNDIGYYECGYINNSLIKHFIREKKIYRKIVEWINVNGNSDKFIVFYDMYMPFLKIICKLKNAYSCLIVPDLVGNLRNDTGIKGLKRLLNNCISNKKMKMVNKSDCYVLLTEQMNDVVNTDKQPYVIVDGIVDDSLCRNRDETSFVLEKKVIMYAGNLSRQYSLHTLIEVFENNKKLNNLELWFCGKGDMEQEIVAASKRDNRIKYLGFLSKQELIQVEEKVAFYINPRTNQGDYTKYSFPSKNIEYLLAGKPVIAYKLDGISCDYDDIFLYVKNNNKESLNLMLERVNDMASEERNEIIKKGNEFVKKHNGKKKQAQLVVSMFESIVNGNVIE